MRETCGTEATLRQTGFAAILTHLTSTLWRISVAGRGKSQAKRPNLEIFEGQEI